MKFALVLAVALVSGAASAASAVDSQTAASAATPEAAVLAGQLRSALASSRDAGIAQGLTGDALELSISSTVESVIVTSGVDPATALAALQIAISDQRCTLTSETTYNYAGCKALADIKTTVSAAIGGPAALGGAGAVPAASNGPPPTAPNGANYGN